MAHPELPTIEVGGFKEFPFQLARDEDGAPMIISDDIIKMYLGYCMRCKLERAEPQNFHGWLHTTDPTHAAPSDAPSEAGA